MKINFSLIEESIRIGNLLHVKYFHSKKQIPKEIDINAKNKGNFNYLIFQNNI